jgi:hypothetical protein
MLTKNIQNRQILFAAVAYLVQGLALEALLKLRVEKFQICSVVSKIEQWCILFLTALGLNIAAMLSFPIECSEVFNHH